MYGNNDFNPYRNGYPPMNMPSSNGFMDMPGFNLYSNQNPNQWSNHSMNNQWMSGMNDYAYQQYVSYANNWSNTWSSYYNQAFSRYYQWYWYNHWSRYWNWHWSTMLYHECCHRLHATIYSDYYTRMNQYGGMPGQGFNGGFNANPSMPNGGFNSNPSMSNAGFPQMSLNFNDFPNMNMRQNDYRFPSCSDLYSNARY